MAKVMLVTASNRLKKDIKEAKKAGMEYEDYREMVLEQRRETNVENSLMFGEGLLSEAQLGETHVPTAQEEFAATEAEYEQYKNDLLEERSELYGENMINYAEWLTQKAMYGEEPDEMTPESSYPLRLS
jgi:hypothetical protein